MPGLYEEHGLVESDAQLLAEDYCSHLNAATMVSWLHRENNLRLEPHLYLLAHERKMEGPSEAHDPVYLNALLSLQDRSFFISFGIRILSVC